jgi:hypothetical protein
LINFAEKRRTPSVARKTSNQNSVPAIPTTTIGLLHHWRLNVGR